MVRDHFTDTACPEPACGDLGEIVAATFLGQSRVQEEEVEDVLLELSHAEQSHDRDP